MDAALVELAEAHGVATSYWDWQGRFVEVDRDVVVAVLEVLGVDATRPQAELKAVGERPAGVVVRQGEDPGWYQQRDGTTVIVTPPTLPEPPLSWGWMVQLYALRSARSWGAGDLADLARFADWAAGTGAGGILLNPLHAVQPVRPVPASPYSPSSRRYVNPLYLSIEHTSAYRRADPDTRSTVDGLRPPPDTGLVDYDAVWDAKQRALELLWRTEEPEPSTDRFAVYCALAERYGADWRQWPAALRRPDSPAVASEADPDRVAFHAWLQRLCDEQLGAAAKAAAGMPVGIIHDLAVGIDPGGADAWMLQDVLAQGVRIGAPPDAFSQLGQDWALAAWRPDRLAATGYQAYRDLLAATLRHGGGLRVDHVAGLWRLWWIPPGAAPDQGTYVRYDAAAMLGALLTEAYRAGAVVVGEDLGTVMPEVRVAMRERGVLGSAVLWFTRDYAAPAAPFVPPQRWPRLALASISTHDLPTAPGFLSGEHVRVRARLGILGRPAADELAVAAADRAALRELLTAEGLADTDPVLALHALLARTPCRLVMASPYDALGEARQPNLPGTVDGYPNWRIPLPLLLDDLMRDERMLAVARILTNRRS
jgi:4-alpha-glucanotransferase